MFGITSDQAVSPLDCGRLTGQKMTKLTSTLCQLDGTFVYRVDDTR